MYFNKCIILDGISKETFERLIPVWKEALKHYNIEYTENKTIPETVPNPNPQPEPWEFDGDDDEMYEWRTVDCHAKFSLKGCRHGSFNFEAFLYQDKLYIHQGVYNFAHYNAEQLSNIIKWQMLPDLIIIGNVRITCVESYLSWCKKQPAKEQRMIIHNYKIDQEDLANIGIEV